MTKCGLASHYHIVCLCTSAFFPNNYHIVNTLLLILNEKRFSIKCIVRKTTHEYAQALFVFRCNVVGFYFSPRFRGFNSGDLFTHYLKLNCRYHASMFFILRKEMKLYATMMSLLKKFEIRILSKVAIRTGEEKCNN